MKKLLVLLMLVLITGCASVVHDPLVKSYPNVDPRTVKIEVIKENLKLKGADVDYYISEERSEKHIVPAADVRAKLSAKKLGEFPLWTFAGIMFKIKGTSSDMIGIQGNFRYGDTRMLMFSIYDPETRLAIVAQMKKNVCIDRRGLTYKDTILALIEGSRKARQRADVIEEAYVECPEVNYDLYEKYGITNEFSKHLAKSDETEFDHDIDIKSVGGLLPKTAVLHIKGDVLAQPELLLPIENQYVTNLSEDEKMRNVYRRIVSETFRKLEEGTVGDRIARFFNATQVVELFKEKKGDLRLAYAVVLTTLKDLEVMQKIESYRKLPKINVSSIDDKQKFNFVMYCKGAFYPKLVDEPLTIRESIELAKHRMLKDWLSDIQFEKCGKTVTFVDKETYDLTRISDPARITVIVSSEGVSRTSGTFSRKGCIKVNKVVVKTEGQEVINMDMREKVCKK